MVWCTLLFVFGIYFYYYIHIKILIIIISLCGYICVNYYKTTYLKCIQEKNICSVIFFWYKIFCISFFLGFFLCYYHNNKPDELYKLNSIDTSSNYYIKGIVSKIEEKDDAYNIVLDKCCIAKKHNIDIDAIKNVRVLVSSRNLQIKHNKSNIKLKVGDAVKIVGKIFEFSKATNFGQFDEYDYYKNQMGYSCRVYAENIKLQKNDVPFKYKIKREIYVIRDSIYNRIKKVYGNDIEKIEIISAILLGRKSKLDENIKQKYDSAGISHILAISGLHITIIGMTIYKTLLKCKTSICFSSIITIFFIILYGWVTDFSISTKRAITMIIFMILSKLFFRTYDVLNACCLSLISLLIRNPMLINNCGLQLSYLAILGVSVINPPIYKCFDKKTVLIKNFKQLYMEEKTGNIKDYRMVLCMADLIDKIILWFVKAMTAGVSIYIITLPVIINNFYEIKWLSIVINIIVVPLMGVLLVMIIFSLVFAYISPYWAEFCSGSVRIVLDFFKNLGGLCEKIPVNNVIIGHKGVMFTIVYYSIVLITIILIDKVDNVRKLKKEKKRVLIIGAICLQVLCAFSNLRLTSKVDITMLDVGQGDSTCIVTKNKKVILVDCGSSDIDKLYKYRVEDFLKYKGIKCVDYIAISHMDKDHISGVIQILGSKVNKVKVKNILITENSKYHSEFSNLKKLAGDNNVNIIEIKEGDRLLIDDVKFQCIYPYKSDFFKDETNKSINHNKYSMVLCMNYKKFDMLFTGDIECDTEEKIIKNLNGIKEKMDIVKVPHHGSKYSSSEEFIGYFNPKYALISAGKNNNYGHPHGETLDRYLKYGVVLYNTINEGGINIITDGNKVTVKTMNKINNLKAY